jgi:hydrogenase-4 component B
MRHDRQFRFRCGRSFRCGQNSGFVLAFIGFGSKAGVFPFHVWLPHAHPAAPSHISAVMSGVMIKTGIYGILRMYAMLRPEHTAIGNIVLIAGMVSGILGVVYALGQHDLKRLLAYSQRRKHRHYPDRHRYRHDRRGRRRIRLWPFWGLPAACCMFSTTPYSNRCSSWGPAWCCTKPVRAPSMPWGLMKNMRVTGVTFLVGSLAISALPPFQRLCQRVFHLHGRFQGVASGTAFVLSLLAIVSLAVIGGLALACFTKVVGVVFQGEPRSDAARNIRRKWGPCHAAAHGGPGRRLCRHRGFPRCS